MNDVETTQETPAPETSPELSQDTSQDTSPETSPETAEETSESPTYLRDLWSGIEHCTCLLCGVEGWSLETFRQHMAVYHQGVMIEAPPGYEPPVAEEVPVVEPVAEGERLLPETDEEEGGHDG